MGGRDFTDAAALAAAMGDVVGMRILADAQAAVAALWRRCMAPPPDQSVTQFAEAHRVLSARDSSEPGPYRVGRTPWCREPQDCLSARSRVRVVVLMWGAQTGKSTVGLNWTAYTIAANPGPMMAVQPTLNLAKRFSRQRLAVMIEGCDPVRDRIGPKRSRDDANTVLMKDYPGGALVLAGANSAADLRSMPARDLFTDEEDGYPPDVDGEGDPVQLAVARQSTFGRRKHLRTSTPTTRDFSRIETAYLEGDRCRFHVPCPHCGEFQALEWGADKPHGVKWSKGPDGAPVRGSARYVCAVAGCEIHESHKTRMFAAGRWVAAAPGAAGGLVRSFHLSSLYSPLGGLGWDDLATEWHTAIDAKRKGDRNKLRTFINTRLAETYEEDADKADLNALRARADAHPLGIVRWGLVVCTMGVDVQGDRLEATLWAWGRGMERQPVDHRVFYGDPALPEELEGSPWAALTEFRRGGATHESGRAVPVLACGVDSGGHHTQAVYVYARAHKHAGVFAVKGRGGQGRAILAKPVDIDINWRGRRVPGGVQLWHVGVDTAKRAVYDALRVTAPGPGFVHLSKHLPADYVEQLIAERIRTRYVKGHPVQEWILPPGKRNEGLDCGVYALAGAHKAGIERWSDGEWRRWEQRIAVRDLFDGAAAADTAGATPSGGAATAATPSPREQAATPASSAWHDYRKHRNPRGPHGR